jgi:hypothetical protein
VKKIMNNISKVVVISGIILLLSHINGDAQTQATATTTVTDAPKIIITSIPDIVPKIRPTGEIYFKALQNTQFVISTDNTAETAKIMVKIDDNEFEEYTQPIVLPPGKHILIVKAQNNAGVWSDEYKVKILVRKRHIGVIIGLCTIFFLIVAHLV